MARGKNQHVVKHPRGWAVKGAGNSKAIKVTNVYEKRAEVEKYAQLVSYEDIKENCFNLNISRYVDTFEDEVEIDIKSVQQEIDALEAEFAEVRGQMAAFLREVIT